MPSAYAHYRFGRDVLKGLGENTRETVLKNYGMFAAGLMGPDLLFFYRPLRSNTVTRKGSFLHARSAVRFFRDSGEVMLRYGFAPEYLAYIYGFICHFALDRECHPYICAEAASGGVSHAETEAEFDRALMARDGVRAPSSGYIRPSMRSAYFICSFFDGVTAKQIYKAQITAKLFNSMLSVLFAAQRSVTRLITGAGERCGDCRCPRDGKKCRGDLLCRGTNRVLMKKYIAAVPRARELIEEYTDSVSGNIPWNSLYGCTFGGRQP